MTAQLHGAVPASAIAAANVRAESARRRISQAQLARALGLSRMSVSDRFRGRTPWSIDELSVVAAVMGLELADILPGSAPNQAGGHGLRVVATDPTPQGDA